MRNRKFKLALGVILPAALALPALAVAQGGAPISIGEHFPGLPLFDELAHPAVPQEQDQVRIEERVVIRIAPLRPAMRTQLEDRSKDEEAPKLREKPMGDCLPVDGIAGVGLGTNNRLVFVLRDRRLVSVHLDRACPAREFYSGLYVERNEDGRLCVKRDRLHARSGATCAVDSLYWVVTQSD